MKLFWHFRSVAVGLAGLAAASAAVAQACAVRDGALDPRRLVDHLRHAGGATAEQCAMMQNVVAEDRPEVGLSVVVLRTADNKAEILRVLAPLGVLLPNGLGLNVDGKDIGRAYFVRCFQDGCYAEVILEKPLLDTLSTERLRPSSSSRRRKRNRHSGRPRRLRRRLQGPSLRRPVPGSSAPVGVSASPD